MVNPITTIKWYCIAGCKVFTVLLTCLFIIHYSYAQPYVRAQKGVLDLRQHNWTKNGIYDLNGEWAFYWKALYTPSSFDTAKLISTTYADVPDFWNNFIHDNSLFKPAFGYATYRLQVLCPSTGKPLALKFLTVASSYTLFVNGKQIAHVGKVGKDELTTIAAFQPIIVPVTPVNNRLDIIIQVANFTYNTGGLWDFIKLGTKEQLETYHIRNVAADFFTAGSFILMGIFYIVVYFFFNRRKSPLYFALFCFLVGIRPLVTGEININYITNWNWQFIKHLEFLTVYLTVPVLSLFSFELFPAEFSKKILRYILLISAPFIAATLFTSPFIFRYTLLPFQLFILLSAGYGLYVYIRAVKNKRTGSFYFLAGFIALFITIINDILYNSLLIQSTDLLYAGLYILIICQAITLSKQFFNAYAKIKKLNNKLEQANNELNIKNNTINETNEQLSKLNAELDSLVFRTSHDLRSPITSLYAMADVIKGEEDKEVRNEYIDFLKKTIIRLDNMITEILQFAKNRSTALQYEKINLATFIQDALQDHVFSYNSERIKRMVDVQQCCPFVTDKARLSMIVSNLISNALKHHNIEQKNPYLKIVVQVTEKQAEIEVTDNGQGIAEQHLGNIFTKFYRVNTTSAGSGFGLYIVKETVEKLGGNIRVESKMHAGTSFFVVIPNEAHL